MFQLKAKGDAAFQAGRISEAIELYTKAINVDGSNHALYSNRSAAYLKHGDAQNALDDASACISLNPDFAKGYSRKGSALHALDRLNDAAAAYKEGLEKFPTDDGLKKGLVAVEAALERRNNSEGGLFGSDMMAQMSKNPRLVPYLADPYIQQKIKQIQKDPSALPVLLQEDPKMMEFLGLLMGQDLSADKEKPTSSEAARKKQPDPEPMEVEEDWSSLSEQERAEKERQKAAILKKDEGNKLYKEKKFDESLKAYDEAIEIDPANMTFYSNKAAVYFTQKKYDECIDMCMKAVEVGKENRAPFEDRAKALTRAAKAYQKKGDLEKAIELCNSAQLENYDKETQRLLKTLELEKKKADAAAYQDDEKAEEAKQRGNDLFRAQKYGEAVKAYEEAVKRSPKNAAIRNNLAAALCKIMDFNGAQRQIDVALELDPKYVKAWARKGDIEMYMKEYHKAMESYKRGLDIDEENGPCKEGLRKCMTEINYGRRTMTEEQKKEQAAHAMADPQIQAILQDPVMQQVLRDFGENPDAAQRAMLDPTVRSKIEKLIASGIIETR